MLLKFLFQQHLIRRSRFEKELSPAILVHLVKFQKFISRAPVKHT